MYYKISERSEWCGIDHTTYYQLDRYSRITINGIFAEAEKLKTAKTLSAIEKYCRKAHISLAEVYYEVKNKQYTKSFQMLQNKLDDNLSIDDFEIAYAKSHYDCSWHNYYYGVHHNLRTAPSDTELDEVVNYLQTSIVPNYKSLYSYCKSIRTGITRYHFHILGDVCNYSITMVTLRGDYNLRIHQYKKI